MITSVQLQKLDALYANGQVEGISADRLESFSEEEVDLPDEIKNNYQPGTFLNVFAAMPVSANVEFGRLILPRADMPMKIYNLNDKSTEYKHAITINNKEENKK